jgi:hypothetical protein
MMLKKFNTVDKVESFVKELYESTQVKNDSIRIQEGNSKLHDILNFSIPAVLSCKPGKTDACTMNCYVLNSYNRYKEHVMESHKANYIQSFEDNFTDRMIVEIEKQLNRPKYKNMHVTFRIHVSGDFYSYEYFEKWVKITDYFEGKNISFGCYTKSIPFIKLFLKNNNRTLDSININFMASVWHDTKPKMLKMIDELNMNIFTAYDGKQELPQGFLPCADDTQKGACGVTCNLCYEKDTDRFLTPEFKTLVDLTLGRKKIAIAIH